MNDLLSDKDDRIVRQLLIENLDVAPDQITPDAHLMHDLGADSLTMIEIGMALEERFEIAIPDEQLERIETVRDIYEALARVLTRTGGRS